MKRVSSTVKSANQLKFAVLVLLLTLFSIFISSCSNDDDQPSITIDETSDTVQDDDDDDDEPVDLITELSQEIKDLIYYNGDEKAPTVLISIPGGPSTEFTNDIVNYIVDNFNTTDILTVNVQQAQTLNPNIVAGSDITLDQAVNINSESMETLSQVITYFKNEGRTVYVYGMSFGAFVAQELIALKGIDFADKYLIMSGRLDMNDVMWQALAEGKEGYFENGVTPIVDSDPHPDVIERNLLRMAAGLGMNRYTQVLNTIDDLSNVTYVYGSADQAVGSLTADEVAFLQSKNVNIIAGDGDHTSTFFDLGPQGLSEAFGIN
jgi:hypothetical protein